MRKELATAIFDYIETFCNPVESTPGLSALVEIWIWRAFRD